VEIILVPDLILGLEALARALLLLGLLVQFLPLDVLFGLGLLDAPGVLLLLEGRVHPGDDRVYVLRARAGLGVVAKGYLAHAHFVQPLNRLLEVAGRQLRGFPAFLAWGLLRGERLV